MRTEISEHATTHTAGAEAETWLLVPDQDEERSEDVGETDREGKEEDKCLSDLQMPRMGKIH
jgi:hypothetical protein